MRGTILAFAAGILALQQSPALPGGRLLGVLAVVAALVWGWGRGSAHRARLTVPLAACLAGVVWAGAFAQWRLDDALDPAWEGRTLRLTGVVAALPQRFEQGERFAFDVEAVEPPEARVPRRIFLSWYRSRDLASRKAPAGAPVGEALSRSLRPGERWSLAVRLKQAHGTANPHGFDYEAWLFERGLRATGSVRARDGHWRLDPFVWRPAYVVERLREAIRARLLETLPGAPYAGILVALTVGDQRSISSAQWEVFNRTGITHLVSISGLHVTMVAALAAWLVGAFWRLSAALAGRFPAQKAAVIAGWCAAGGYALLAGFEVPAQRTFYMLSAVALAQLSGRHFGPTRTLALALLAVLVLDPWAVLATGFWLSFCAVAVLLFAGDARLRPVPGWRGAICRWGEAQWAVTVASLPLLLFLFQQFSLVSPLANALAIPLVSFVIAPLALVHALIPWSLLMTIDHWLLALLMRLLEALAVWPVWQQPVPQPWSLPLAAVGIVWCLMPRGFPARPLGALLLAPALFMPAPRPSEGEAWIDVLDVGQGLATVVRTRSRTLLYDAGPRYSPDANAGERIVVPFLRAVGISSLDMTVISHGDLDHAGGLPAILDAYPETRLLTSMSGVGGERCLAGQSWEWEGVRFAMLHPLQGAYAVRPFKTNRNSCVLRVSAGGQSVLMTGDIDAAAETALIGREPEALRSWAIVVPHHGSTTSSSMPFVAAVAAREAVFSAGYRNMFSHPRPEVVARYTTSRRWRTDRDGAVRLLLSPTPSATAWRDERPRYWHKR